MSDPVDDPVNDSVSAPLAEQISALLDGELSETEADALELLLQDCAPARALLKSLSVQRRALLAQFPLAIPVTPTASDSPIARPIAIAGNETELEPSKATS